MHGSVKDLDAHTYLTFTTLRAYSADDRLMIFFLFFTENSIRHFMQIVSNFHEMSNPVFFEKNKKNISKCHLLKISPGVLSAKHGST